MKAWLQVIVRDSRSFRDGDVLSACTWRKARYITACNALFRRRHDRRLQRINRAGLLDHGDPIEDFCEACFSAKLVRTGRDTCRKIRLSDQATIDIQDNERFTDFSGRERKMRVDQYFRRELKTAREANGRGSKWLFGTSDNEAIFYIGKETYGHPQLDSVWTAIEAKLPVTEQDSLDNFRPFSDARRRLWLATDDMSEQESQTIISEQRDGEGIVTAKRSHYVLWRDLPGIVESQVLDRRVELREDKMRQHDRLSIVQQK